MARLRVFIPDGRTLAEFYANIPGRNPDGSLFGDQVQGIMGPWGSGKSTVCVNKIREMSKKQRQSTVDGVRRSRWAIIRETVVEMRSTTMNTYFDWIPKSAGKWRDAGPPRHQVRIRADDGSIVEMEVLFLAMDNPRDVAQLDSLELTGAWVNEARHLLWENIRNLSGRCDRYPSMSEGGSSLGPVVMFDTNPPDTDHWWYEKFEEERPEGWKMYQQPSGLSAQAENLHFLAPGYYQNMVKGMAKEWVQVYAHGRYGYSKDGKPVYENDFIDDWHTAPEPLIADDGLPLRLGLDAGGTPAMVVTQRRPNGQWRWLDEVIGDFGMTGPKRFAEDCKMFLEEHYGRFIAGLTSNSGGRYLVGNRPDVDMIEATADPSAVYGADTEDGELNWIQIFRAVTGIHVRPASTNSRDVRIEVLRGPLSRNIDGAPAFQISPTMKVTRKGLISGYRYRRMQVGGSIKFTNVPEKNIYSHPIEAGQYVTMGDRQDLAVTMGRGDRDRRAALIAQGRGQRPRSRADYDEFA